jgi:hypothetical protein
MKFQDFVKIFFAIALCAGAPFQGWSQHSTSSVNGTCVVKAAGVQLHCPARWEVVEETETGTSIGNFDRPDRTGNLTIPAGRATITVHPMPGVYKNFKEWVYAATKITPDAVQTNKTVTNKTVGSINLVCFTSPDSQRGWTYTSYFFQMNGTPVNLELNYQRASQNASEYRAVLDKIIESLELRH